MLKDLGVRPAPKDYCARIEQAKTDSGSNGFDVFLVQSNSQKFYAIARRALGLSTNGFSHREWLAYEPIFVAIVRTGIDPVISALLHDDSWVRSNSSPSMRTTSRPKYPQLARLAHRATVLNYLRLIALNEHGPNEERRAQVALQGITAAIPYVDWDELFLARWTRSTAA